MIRVGAAAFALLVLGKRCVRRAGTNSGGATHAAKEHDMLVDVGGHKLEVVSAGTKGPTVVLESGFGATSDFWEKVQHGASEFVAQELHSALHAGQFAPPNVLVGHSIGSFYIRVFANTYPREVCGMVFVDPVSEDFYEWMRTHQPEDWKQMEAASSQLPEGLRNELAGKDESAEQARQAWPLPKVPIILITATKPMPPYFTPMTIQAWTQMHQEFAENFPGIEQIVTDKSTHMVPLDQPELVVSAIR